MTLEATYNIIFNILLIFAILVALAFIHDLNQEKHDKQNL